MLEIKKVTPEQSALLEAINAAGGQSELARKLTAIAPKAIKQQQIWNWLHREKKAPPSKVALIEMVTGIARSKLRPYLYQ